MTSFPHDFLWGAATAGHQVEGGNVNADLWPMEWAPDSTFNEPSGDACDHYHRYPEDIAVLAELGLNAYRFSVEWSRIEPEPGFYSRAALDHYKRMIESCLNQGVTPVVTYNHFTVPRWMAGRGGWSAADAPERFAAYAARGDRARRRPLVLGLHAERAKPDGDDAQHRGPRHGDGRPSCRNRARRGADTVGSEGTTLPVIGWGSWRRASSRWPTRIVWRYRRSRRRPEPSRRDGPWRSSTCSPQEGGEERWHEARRLGQTDWLSVSADDDFVGVQTYSRARIGPDGQLPVPGGGGHHADRLGGVSRGARPHGSVGRRARRSTCARDRERHGDRRRCGAARLHPRRPRRSGAVHRRRGRRPRLHPLDACSTTSNGTPAIPRRSASSRSTTRHSPGRSSPRPAGSAEVAARNALDRRPT